MQQLDNFPWNFRYLPFSVKHFLKFFVGILLLYSKFHTNFFGKQAWAFTPVLRQDILIFENPMEGEGRKRAVFPADSGILKFETIFSKMRIIPGSHGHEMNYIKVGYGNFLFICCVKAAGGGLAPNLLINNLESRIGGGAFLCWDERCGAAAESVG
ncbi:hypothetical protein [Enterocloster lavalensis]|uniref:hypothetical protein n=2 Tax=Enterocloster lavalensis TaxID=460384 RepID=UPI00140887AD|nr:hypothetical protein [Enterocloster lavalensis]